MRHILLFREIQAIVYMQYYNLFSKCRTGNPLIHACLYLLHALIPILVNKTGTAERSKVSFRFLSCMYTHRIGENQILVLHVAETEKGCKILQSQVRVQLFMCLQLVHVSKDFYNDILGIDLISKKSKSTKILRGKPIRNDRHQHKSNLEINATIQYQKQRGIDYFRHEKVPGLKLLGVEQLFLLFNIMTNFKYTTIISLFSVFDIM